MLDKLIFKRQIYEIAMIWKPITHEEAIVHDFRKNINMPMKKFYEVESIIQKISV